jgi:hypothetical protein
MNLCYQKLNDLFTKPKLVMLVNPDTRHCPKSKFCIKTNFWLRSSFTSRHCASVHLQIFCNRDKFPATYQTCTETHVVLKKICTMTAKTRAIPSLHRDYFSAKAQGQWPVLASGNATYPYCRAVMVNSLRTCILDNIHDY